MKLNLFSDLIAKCKKEIPSTSVTQKEEAAQKSDANEESKKEEPVEGAQAQAQASAAPPPSTPQIRFVFYSNSFKMFSIYF